VEDIPILAEAFAKRFGRRMGRKLAPLTPDCVRRLQACAWPGNVRELENVIERAVITAQNGRLNLERALPTHPVAPAIPNVTAEDPEPRILNAAELEAIERINLERALAAANGKISGAGGAAEILGLPASTVSSRMKVLGIQKPGR
jgi:transcriptional regulator with GAF, ATPase, and Fis domain